jgi:predicted nucleotidyltransferase
MIPEILQKSKERIAEICLKYQIRELSVFGSQVRGDSTAKSDFDFLVEFEPGAKIGFFEFFALQEELEDLVKTKVDVGRKSTLKKVIRNQVLSEAETVYAS